MPYPQFLVGIAGLSLISAVFVYFKMAKRLVLIAALLTAIIGVAAELAVRYSAVDPSYYDPWYSIAVVCGCYAAALSILYGFEGFGTNRQRENPHAVRIKAMILGFWVIGPPVWFAIDYFLVFNHKWAQTEHGDVFERFKYGQDVASKVWVALVTLFTGLYFGKDFTPSKSK